MLATNTGNLNMYNPVPSFYGTNKSYNKLGPVGSGTNIVILRVGD